MIRVLPVLFLLLAPCLSTPLDSWEGSKGWEDQNSWRSVKTWEDNLNGNNKKNLKDQKGWGDEMGLESKNWDSLSDSTILVETHNWNRKRRSLEESENGATEEPARDSMETAEVNATSMPATLRLKKQAAQKTCRRMLALYEVEKRRYNVSVRLSKTFIQPVSYTWTCNDFCCYPALS